MKKIYLISSLFVMVFFGLYIFQQKMLEATSISLTDLGNIYEKQMDRISKSELQEERLFLMEGAIEYNEREIYEIKDNFRRAQFTNTAILVVTLLFVAYALLKSKGLISN